jgi:HEAT repeat protein
MNLVKRLKAGRCVRRLKASRSLPPAVLTRVQEDLVKLGPFGLPRVLECLSHGEARGPALEVLTRLLDNEVLPLYLDALGSANPAVVSGVAEVLERSRGYDPAQLIDLLADRTLPKGVLEGILTAQAPRMPPRKLMAVLPGLSKEARGMVFRLLERNADETVLAPMLELLGHEDWWIRLYMVKLLTRYEVDRVAPALVPCLEDPHKSVRLEAVRALRRLEARPWMRDLVGALRDPDLKVQTEVIDAVIELGDTSAVPHLLEVLKDESEYARRAAVEVLNELATTEAVQDLVRALRDEDWWVRVRAADALGALGGERVVDAVLGLLGDEDEFVRRYAVEILNAVPSERAVDALIQALGDRDWWVRERSIDALARTRDLRAVDPLLELMTLDETVVPLCARALGAIGDVRAVEPLRCLAASDNEEVRREAAGALKLLCPGEPETGDPERASEILDAAPVGEESEERIEVPFRVEGRRPGSGSDEAGGPPEVAPGPLPSREPFPPATPRPDETEPAPTNFRELTPGMELLHRYRVVERIGRGGFGAIYLVEDTAVQDRIIFKILNPHLSEDVAAIRRFVQELKLTRKITHKNVIRIHDLVDLGGAHAVSMEYFPGRDLGKILTEAGKLDPWRALHILEQACEGLAAAHEAGVIHRDIKPGNILVGMDDAVKIVDFGLAWAEQRVGSRLTKSGLLIGTPEYMAPEQIRGEAADHRVDVYSLGIVLYEMVTGRPPYTADTPVKVLFQHLEGEATPMSELSEGVPPGVEALTAAAMAREPDDRVGSAKELARRIRELVDGASLEPRRRHA